MNHVTTNNRVVIEVNNVKSRILFNPEIYTENFQQCLKAIDAKLAFLLPNAENNKNYNTILADGSRLWDGKRHLFNSFTHNKYGLMPFEFYTGKIKTVLETLYRFGFRAATDDRRIRHPLHLNSWEWNPKKIPYDYQEGAITNAVRVGRGILQVATGGGKTLIGAAIIHRLGLSPFIFFVTSRDLLYQAHDAFTEALQTDVGVIGDGKCDIRAINVCTIQTCVSAFGKESDYLEQCRQMQKYGEEVIIDKKEAKVDTSRHAEIRELIRTCKGIIFDEVHHLASDTCSMILELCDNAFYRFGLGATVKRDDGMDPLIEALLGEYLCDITASFLIKKGRLIPPHIYMIPSENYEGECESYSSEYKTYITHNKARNNAIVKTAQKAIAAKISTLILVKHIEHGALLKEQIEGSVFIQGAITAKKRKEIIQKVRNGELFCILATSLADEGLDIVCLECLILAGSGKSIVKAMQRVGRVLRPDPENLNKRAIVIDFMDGSQYLHSHALKRKKLYTSEPEFKVYDMRYKNQIQKAIQSQQDLFA